MAIYNNYINNFKFIELLICIYLKFSILAHLNLIITKLTKIIK